MSDPYLYGDGSKVLANKAGITDSEALQAHEYRVSAARTPLALRYAARATRINEKTWCEVHRLLLGEIYGWAGKFRTVGLSKGKTEFAPPAALRGWADKHVFPLFKQEAKAAGGDLERFALALAKCWGELNFLHPFREGNGRCTHIIVRELAARHGWVLYLERIEHETEVAAAKASVEKDYAPYMAILRVALERVVRRKAAKGRRTAQSFGHGGQNRHITD
jgi:cell filamentation protein